jgi:Fe-S-cluster-containing hydrogenase component 2/CRP-like cAMP-binding protein/thioredoxin reductase
LDVSDHYHIAIIGSGPAGLSAAATAASFDRKNGVSTPSHILLESEPHHANTIQRYQKGKHVMDEPGYLDLRSPIEFSAGTREEILGNWQEGIRECGINLRSGAEVTSISGQQGNFQIRCGDGSELSAENIVLAIGTQGNPRRLGVAGDTSNFVQYQLDDPDEYCDEQIVVIGAGDAAIENALALSRKNKVVIVNRKGEFSRAKPGNLDAVLAAINDRDVPFSCRYNSAVKALTLPSQGESGSITLRTAEGEETLPCHRVIARLGSIPPRGFLDATGIALPNDSPEAVPELDRHYQSNIPGLYIVGALGGYPLIKQGMNQGHDVVHFIHGEDIKPVDHPLLALKFALLPYRADVNNVLDLYQQRIPMFSRMNALAFRELIMESDIHYSIADEQLFTELCGQGDALREQRLTEIQALRDSEDRQRASLGKAAKPRKAIDTPVTTRLLRDGDFVYRDGEYSNSFYSIIEGEVTLSSPQSPDTVLKAGQFFGELSLLSGRPRVGSARVGSDAILIETPRRTMVKLMASNAEVSRGIELVFLQRSLQQFFAPAVPYSEFRDIARSVSTRSYNRGDTLYRQGETGERLYLVRSGTIALSRKIGEVELAIGQYHSGQIVGQMVLMGDPERRETAVAAVRSEVIEIDRQAFFALLKTSPDAVSILQRETSQQLKAATALESMPENAALNTFLLDKGAGEATNVLLIDENLCIGCDNCEVACAETHKGISRLNRKSGVRFANINLPIACRHCEQPHCMKECPPDAIHRKASGEVFIDDSCIGCGNCESNCPYGVIKMSYPAPQKPGLFDWLLFGRGPGPGEHADAKPDEAAKAAGKKAVKCDACMDRPSGPACVQSCPTGAAQRMGPEQFVKLLASE